jgi:transcriptional regulator with XRE-family HTH domain
MEGLACPSCTDGEIVMRKAGPGRRVRYRHIPDLETPAELELPTCAACGQQWLDAEASRRLEGALEEAYRAELVRKAERSIETLRQHIPQRELERLLGVSAGWLSKVKNGKETSAPMAALLMLLAEQPHRVESLRRLWAVRPEAPRLFELAPVRVRVQSEPSRPSLFTQEPAHTTQPGQPVLSLVSNEELGEVAA